MELLCGAGMSLSPHMRAQRQKQSLSNSTFTQHRELSLQSGAASIGEELLYFTHVPGIRGRNRCFSCFAHEEDTRLTKAGCTWSILTCSLCTAIGQNQNLTTFLKFPKRNLGFCWKHLNVSEFYAAPQFHSSESVVWNTWVRETGCARSLQGFKGKSNEIMKEIQRGLRYNQSAAVLEYSILYFVWENIPKIIPYYFSLGLSLGKMRSYSAKPHSLSRVINSCARSKADK